MEHLAGEAHAGRLIGVLLAEGDAQLEHAALQGVEGGADSRAAEVSMGQGTNSQQLAGAASSMASSANGQQLARAAAAWPAAQPTSSWQEPSAAAAPTSHGVSEGPRMLAPYNGEAERAAREKLLVVADDGREPRRASLPILGS